ncbi:MAG: hypothetical protein ACTSU5_11425 [Promethearchaeota archaeon]
MAKVPVPTYIFEKKKAGIIKIQIHPGIVCEHQFVAFIDQKFVARGYERIDFQLEIAPRAAPAPGEEVTPRVFLSDVVQKFGSFAATYLLHAVVFNYPVYVVVSPTDAPTLEKSLNDLFVSMIPEEMDPEPLITQMDRKRFLKIKIINEEFFVVDTNGIILNSPWGEKKKMTSEEYLIKKAMSIDEEELQAQAVRSGIRELWQRTKAAAEILEERDSIYESDLKNMLGEKFGIKHSDYQLDLITTMIRRRMKKGERLVKKIRIRSFDKLKEGLW